MRFLHRNPPKAPKDSKTGNRVTQTTLIRSLDNITRNAQGNVATIGNFDGVHLGHQQLLGRVRHKSAELNCPSLVLTFEPHPFEFFKRTNVNIPRLTRFREKFSALTRHGIDHMLLLPFNEHIASMSAHDFVAHILHEKLAIKHLVVGDDFHFGYKRQGDITLLQKLANQYQFTVEALPTIDLASERISSTRIRQALMQGDLPQAESLLGRPYTLQGRVSHGDKLGRQLGFPTANILLHRKLCALSGIFTVLVHGLDHETKSPLPGVANVGCRPTINGTHTLLEIHLLDFEQMIYGRYVEVEFCKKLREEIRYSSIDLLQQQIAQDVKDARHYFMSEHS